MSKKQILVEVISGPEGACLYIDNYRVAGPKPWGGGQVLHSYDVDVKEIKGVLDRLQSVERA